MAIEKAIKEVVWLKSLVSEITFRSTSIVVKYYSQSTIHLTKDLMYHERVKYINVRVHFV